MIQVAKISEEFASEIKGTLSVNGFIFNPVLDNDGNFIVSLESAEYLNNSDYEVIKHNPIINEDEIL